jgi:hypothetical protein
MNGPVMNGPGMNGSGPSGSGVSGPGPSSRRVDDGAGVGDYNGAAVEQQARPSRRQVWDGCPTVPQLQQFCALALVIVQARLCVSILSAICKLAQVVRYMCVHAETD